jgi:hypothetical protein
MVDSSAARPDRPTGARLDTILAAERDCIEAQRANRGAPLKARKYIGLALSGGGIRSASFALGVIQALEAKERLSRVDYLSTVSGGGYIGAALTWFNFLQKGKPYKFPFGAKYESRREHEGTERAEVDNTAFIRQHGEYLTPSKHFTSVSLVGVLLRNIFVTFSVYFALVVSGTLALRYYHDDILDCLPGGWLRDNVDERMLPAVCLLLLFASLSIIFGLFTAIVPKLNPDNHFLYKMRVDSQRLIGWSLVWTFGALICGSIPYIYAAIEDWRVSGATLTTTGTAGVVYEFVKQQRPKLALARPKLNLLILWITVLSIIYGLLLGAYALARAVDPGADKFLLVLYFLAYAVVVGGVMNSNMFSISRMYRDRLMEAFMPDEVAVECRKWRPATKADVTYMKDVCTKEHRGPYHIVNTNVVLTTTDYATYRGRGGDSFIFSPLYSGSEATGWHPTGEICGGAMSLATAMAISGAAVNPNTACGGRGPTRNRLASFVLALFNIRLGYWVRNPHAGPVTRALTKLVWPNLLYPGLRQGLLGTGLHVGAGYIELSDGGHYDNTGIYELVRRGVDTIVLSLASADPGYGFDDLADVIERVRVDFGVYIRFPSMLADAVPCAPLGAAAGAPAAAAGIATGLAFAKNAYVIGSIAYPDGKRGTLVVLKSCLTNVLPVDVIRYACNHAAFPNESTADQFFDERQFEAYREAGYAAADGMLAQHANAEWLETT